MSHERGTCPQGLVSSFSQEREIGEKERKEREREKRTRREGKGKREREYLIPTSHPFLHWRTSMHQAWWHTPVVSLLERLREENWKMMRLRPAWATEQDPASPSKKMKKWRIKGKTKQPPSMYPDRILHLLINSPHWIWPFPNRLELLPWSRTIWCSVLTWWVSEFSYLACWRKLSQSPMYGFYSAIPSPCAVFTSSTMEDFLHCARQCCML